VRVPTLLAVVAALAGFADNRTGRHCAATNAAVAAKAGTSSRTVTTVKGLLAEAGWALEIKRGTGGAGKPSRANRPSIWHLMSRRAAVDEKRFCDLPAKRELLSLSLVERYSPSPGAAAPAVKNSPKRTNRRAAKPPRPLALQRLAAGLIARSVGLGTVHPGQICDALTNSELDLDTWTARSLTDAINADMRATGWSWPDRIAHPGAFLASRLRRLPVRPEPPKSAGTAGASLDKNTPSDRRVATSPEPAKTPATADQRAAARAFFAAHRRRPASATS
jgi:hypothetical protein